MLFGGQHGEYLGEFGDLDDGLVTFEGAWHGYLKILLREQFGCDVSQLVELNFLLLGRYLAEDRVVDVPRLVDVSDAVSDLVSPHP